MDIDNHQDKTTKPIKGRRNSLRVNGYPYIVPNCVCGHPPAVGLLLFFFRGWWQDLHFGHHKTLHSAKLIKNANIIENPLRGSTSCAAFLCRAAHWMMGFGQSLWDADSLIIGGKPQGNLPGSDCGRVCWGGAEVSSTRRRSPWVNLRHSLQVGAGMSYP